MQLPACAVLPGFFVALAIWSAGPAQPAEVTVFLHQATLSGMRELAAGFERATRHRVNIDFAHPAPLKEKVMSDAPGDLLSILDYEFVPYLESGKVVAGSVVEYGRVLNGVAVRAGARRPDISTPEAFRQAMLDAASIGHSGAGTGPFNTRLFRRLGIYDQIRDKIKIVPPGVLVAEAVARGDVEIGIQQVNVIQPYPGTDYLGPLPPTLIEYGHANVGLLAASRQPEVAKAFIAFMTDPANAGLLRKGSMEPPGR